MAQSVPGMTTVVHGTVETAANVPGTTVVILGGEAANATIYTTN